MKVLIADDHPVVRRGLRQILTEEIPGVECEETPNSRETEERVRRGDCDLILLDISMPGRSGLDILKELKRISPRTAIVIMSVHLDGAYIKYAFRAGASGYLTKESAAPELVEAIHKILAGGTYVSHSLANQLASLLGPPSTLAPHEQLSHREYELMTKLGQGLTVKEIAGDLFLSVKTVSTYRTRLLKKMNLRHNADLMRYVMRNGLAG
jgi:DNA-binding NarL/FixJ family response regulator